MINETLTKINIIFAVNVVMFIDIAIHKASDFVNKSFTTKTYFHFFFLIFLKV